MVETMSELNYGRAEAEDAELKKKLAAATCNCTVAFQGRHRIVIRDWGRINNWLDCLVRATEP